MKRFYVCIMAGGSGERFWPLSRQSLPKHLLRLFFDHTLVEETVRRIASVVPLEHIFVLTNAAQLDATRTAVTSLPACQIYAEPVKRDTAPACAFGTALVRARDPEAVVAFLPADALIHDTATFARQLSEAATLAFETDAFITFGIKPTHPATSFGYLKIGEPYPFAGTQTEFFHIEKFVEKPDEATARSYLQTNQYSWNAGMFLWKSSVFLEEARQHQPDLVEFIEKFPADDALIAGYLAEEFPKLTKISIDYAIMEKARNVVMARADFDWDDVGSWTSLPEHLTQDGQNNTIRGEVVLSDAANNIVFSQKRLIALSGVNDLIVVETDDAILVCHRDQAQHIKKIYSQLPEKLK